MVTNPLFDKNNTLHRFISHYSGFRDEFLTELCEMGIPEPAPSWITKMMDYNTKGGTFAFWLITCLE